MACQGCGEKRMNNQKFSCRNCGWEIREDGTCSNSVCRRIHDPSVCPICGVGLKPEPAVLPEVLKHVQWKCHNRNCKNGR